MSAYLPPALTASVTLAGGYTAPALTTPVILCVADGETGGLLFVDFAVPNPEAAFDAREQPNRLGESLWAKLAAPLQPGLFRARERAYLAAMRFDTNAGLPAATLSGQAHLLLSASAWMSVAALTPAALFTGDLRQSLELPSDIDGPRAALRHDTSPSLAGSALDCSHAPALVLAVPLIAPQAAGVAQSACIGVQHTDATRLRRPMAMRQTHGVSSAGGSLVTHANTTRLRRPMAMRQTHGVSRAAGSLVTHAERIRRRRRLSLPHARARGRAHATAVSIDHSARPGVSIRGLRLFWQHTDRPRAGRWWPIYEPPGLRVGIPCGGGYEPRPLACGLLLGVGLHPQPPCPSSPAPGTVIIPIREVYIVTNSFALATVEGGHEIVPTSTFTAALDADSWAWTWSTTVHADYLALLRPGPDGPVELIATINGHPIRLRVDALARTRRFGRRDLRISGRSRSAALAAPAAPVVTRIGAVERTARQIADDVLTDNGVPLGWDLDWRIQDWLVPAGAWHHTGTYLEAITRIASAAGAYVQPHDEATTLRILPRYPLAPWDWPGATPDLALPEDVVTVEGIEWSEKPWYDAVYLIGTGILGHVVRAGFSGGTVAPMVVDELLGHSDATLQRGRAILSDTGRQARIRLNLPVLPETGLIKPGLLVDYTEQGTTHRGLTRGISVAVDFPRVVQTVEIETHESI